MEAFLISMIIAAAPFAFAGIGELVAERSGVLNLGVEGMMLVGAVAAFAVGLETGSSAIGVIAGAVAGAAMASIFALLTLGLLSNQAATGLALTIFGVGLSGLIGQGYVGVALTPLPTLSVEGVTDVHAVTRVLFEHDAMIWLAIALILGVWWMITRTRAGLILRASGESAESAHALGLPVILVRALAVLFGGACAGLGGAYLSLVYTPMWGENMTAGRGWIALALVVFAAWRPLRLAVGALLFAAVTQLQFYGQDWGVPLPSQALAAAPYLATIIALVLLARGRVGAPAALGRPFRAER